MATKQEMVRDTFFKYSDSIKSRSVRWTIKGDSKWGDRRISKYIKYFFLPIKEEDVIALLDTTVLRSGKEGYLFTTEGIIVKEIVEKLYYLEYSKIDHAEVLEERDDYYNLKTSVWVHFKDGTKRQIFDFYINKYFFVEYINDIVKRLW